MLLTSTLISRLSGCCLRRFGFVVVVVVVVVPFRETKGNKLNKSTAYHAFDRVDIGYDRYPALWWNTGAAAVSRVQNAPKRTQQ